jgi:hypothetical protein
VADEGIFDKVDQIGERRLVEETTDECTKKNKKTVTR